MNPTDVFALTFFAAALLALLFGRGALGLFLIVCGVAMLAEGER